MQETIKKALEDIPEERVKEIAADFQSEGAIVTVLPQKNGRWTVVAEFSAETLKS